MVTGSCLDRALCRQQAAHLVFLERLAVPAQSDGINLVFLYFDGGALSPLCGVGSTIDQLADQHVIFPTENLKPEILFRGSCGRVDVERRSGEESHWLHQAFAMKPRLERRQKLLRLFA